MTIRHDAQIPTYSYLPDRDPRGFIRTGFFQCEPVTNLMYQFQSFQKKLESTTGLNLYDIDTCV